MNPEMQSFQFGAAQFVFDPTGQSGTLIKFCLPALQLMVVSRGQMPTGTVWHSPGIYFLFGVGDQVGTYRIYAGMAPAGVARRIGEQEKLKEWWDRALLVVADRSTGFTTSEVAWLEARFIAKLRTELGVSELSGHLTNTVAHDFSIGPVASLGRHPSKVDIRHSRCTSVG